MSTAKPFDVILAELNGKQMSSVEFVQDYLQLRFDGPTINVMTRTTVKADGKESKSWDDQFRNMLCGQIAKIVVSAVLVPDEELKICFDDQSEVLISLKPKDFNGPEGIYFHGFKDSQWGVA